MSDPGPSPTPATLDHSDRGGTILAVHWTFTSLATVFLALRLYCKRINSRSLWWDDWILIAAWGIIIAVDGVTTCLVAEFHLGKHSWDLTIGDQVSKWIILLSTRATLTVTASGWTKTAFAVTLLRLTQGWTRRLVWFIAVTLNIMTVISALIPWIQCIPVKKTWIPTVPGNCWAPKVGTKIWIATGAYNGLMDFTLALLPWTFLYTVLLVTREKVGVLIAMSMGVFAGATAIAKCVNLPNLGSGDSYNEVELYIWDVIEATVTMIAACIPTFRVLISKAKLTTAQRYELSNTSFSAKTATKERGFREIHDGIDAHGSGSEVRLKPPLRNYTDTFLSDPTP